VDARVAARAFTAGLIVLCVTVAVLTAGLLLWFR